MPMCPICGKDAKPRTENKAAPFCNARCKSVDLGKWLDEDYRIPVEGSSSDAEEEQAARDVAASAAPPSRGDVRN
jgi:uncharacterized protein